MERVNLIPKSELEARAMRAHAGRWVAAVLCVAPLVVAALSLKCYQEGRANKADAENQQLTVTIEASRRALGDLRAAVAGAGARRARAYQMQDKRRWSALISQVVSVMPPGISLTSLSSDPPVPGAPRVAVAKSGLPEANGGYAKFEVDAARGLIVQGVCADPASPLRFVTALRRTGMFEEISNEHVRRSGGEAADTFQFEIRCKW